MVFEEKEKQDTQASTPGNSSPNNNNSPSPERYVQKQPDRQLGGIWGTLSRLGNLPEWGINGKKMSGKPLNYGIGVIASCGFLMFGSVISQ